MVVEARLLARLLGVRLLRVEGTVLMSPGRLVAPPASALRLPASRRVAVDGGAHPGDGLAEAARLLAESDASLRRARR